MTVLEVTEADVLKAAIKQFKKPDGFVTDAYLKHAGARDRDEDDKPGATVVATCANRVARETYPLYPPDPESPDDPPQKVKTIEEVTFFDDTDVDGARKRVLKICRQALRELTA